MFMLEGISAAQACASERNCDANDCNFWLPTSWCGGEDSAANNVTPEQYSVY